MGSLATATADNLMRNHGWELTSVRRAAQVGCYFLFFGCGAVAWMHERTRISVGDPDLSLIMKPLNFNPLIPYTRKVGCFLLPAACFAGSLATEGVSSLGLIMMGQSFHGLAMAGIW